MMKNLDAKPDCPDASHQLDSLIVETDVQAFIEARRVVVGLRRIYLQLYDYIFKNWDKLDRPVSRHHSSIMHG